MTYNDIIAALRDIGLGGTDALTHETVISGATLDESINGDGGLTVSWKSTEGGMIRGGTMFMGYVMKENYVPTLGSDGIYMWSPKFSEPAVLLGKNNFGKSLLLHVSSDIYVKKATEEVAATVVAVVDTDRDLPAVTSLSTGTFAIVKNPKTIYASNSRLRKVIVFQGVKQWSDNGQVISENGICRKGATGHYWRYVGGGWIDIGTGDGTVESTVYTSPFCGELRTIVEDLNTLLAQKLPGSPNFSIELRSDNPDSEEAEAEVYALSQTFINVTFDGSTLKELIDKIAEAADAHAYYVGRKIIIGRTRAYADTDFFNRFIVLGGTKNMAKRTFNGQGYAAITQRLHLDENDYPGSVIDLRSSANEAPFEAFLVFDDIYPKLNLNIATAKYCICYCLDDNGKKIPATSNPNEENPRDWKLYAKWYVTLELDGQPYTIDKNYIIQDKPLSLLFQSGPLTGRQFELTMLTAGSTERNPDFALQVAGDGNSLPESHTVTAGECYIILEADGDFLLPTLPATFDNGGLCPQADNWVTLVNVAIEDSFRIVAQKELLKKGRERAELIYESKQPTISEERTFTDSLTGENSGDAPGLGEPYKGYIVTGISENIITGAKTVTYGTFKPKPLMKSAIDKIEAFTLSGGEATTGKEVSTKTDGQTTIIYIHDENEGGDNSTPGSSKGGSSGTTSQSQSSAIRQAGGNVNIKTVYEKIAESSGEAAEGSIFAGLADLLWKHRSTLVNKWSSVTLTFSVAPTSSGYWYDGSSLKYGGETVSDASLEAAFDAVYSKVGYTTISVAVDSFPASIKHNLCIEPLSTNIGSTPYDGGIRAWMYDGSSWVVILSSTTALLDVLGDSIRMAVFGAADGSIQKMIETTGMLTTQNLVEIFSTATINNTTVAQATFGLGIKYHVQVSGVTPVTYRDVRYTGGAKKEWKYSDDNTTYTDTDDDYYDSKVAAIEPYGFSGITADMIDFNGKIINLAAQDRMIFRSSYGSGTNSLIIDEVGNVILNDTTISNAAVNGVLTVDDGHIYLRHYPSTPSHSISPYTGLVIRSPQASSDDVYNNHVIEAGMKEFTVSGGTSSNSFLNLLSFKSDWATSLGHIKMKCGNGNGTDVTNHSRSEIKMGFGAQDNVYLCGDYEQTSLAWPNGCNKVAVRGRFAIIPDDAATPLNDSTFLYGQGTSDYPKTFTTADGKTVTVIGGIITGIT